MSGAKSDKITPISLVLNKRSTCYKGASRCKIHRRVTDRAHNIVIAWSAVELQDSRENFSLDFILPPSRSCSSSNRPIKHFVYFLSGCIPLPPRVLDPTSRVSLAVRARLCSAIGGRRRGGGRQDFHLSLIMRLSHTFRGHYVPGRRVERSCWHFRSRYDDNVSSTYAEHW